MCLIPEIRFEMDKLCDFVKSILDRKDYCVLCIAEGGLGRGGMMRVVFICVAMTGCTCIAQCGWQQGRGA